MDLEQEMQDLSDSASLFEVNLPEYKLLRQSRREIKMLKTLWDYIFIGIYCAMQELCILYTVYCIVASEKKTLYEDISVGPSSFGNQLFVRPTRSDLCRIYGLVLK